MASTPSPVTSAPDVPGQPYDATSDATISGWGTVDSGPANAQGQASGDFENGPAPWKQT